MMAKYKPCEITASASHTYLRDGKLHVWSVTLYHTFSHSTSIWGFGWSFEDSISLYFWLTNAFDEVNIIRLDKYRLYIEAAKPTSCITTGNWPCDHCSHHRQLVTAYDKNGLPFKTARTCTSERLDVEQKKGWFYGDAHDICPQFLDVDLRRVGNMRETLASFVKVGKLKGNCHASSSEEQPSSDRIIEYARELLGISSGSDG